MLSCLTSPLNEPVLSCDTCGWLQVLNTSSQRQRNAESRCMCIGELNVLHERVCPHRIANPAAPATITYKLDKAVHNSRLHA